MKMNNNTIQQIHSIFFSRGWNCIKLEEKFTLIDKENMYIIFVEENFIKDMLLLLANTTFEKITLKQLTLLTRSLKSIN